MFLFDKVGKILRERERELQTCCGLGVNEETNLPSSKKFLQYSFSGGNNGFHIGEV
jgi:hypothetical protein